MHSSRPPFVLHVLPIFFFFINLNVANNCISFIHASRNEASSSNHDRMIGNKIEGLCKQRVVTNSRYHPGITGGTEKKLQNHQPEQLVCG
jgi:hypothetical protein